MKLFVSFFAIPALLLIFLVENYLNLAIRRAEDEAREVFPQASEKMLEGIKPERFLSYLIQIEFPNSDPIPEVNDLNAVSIAARISVSIGGKCRLFGFNTDGKMVFPKEGVLDQAEREALWRGGWDYNSCEPFPKRFPTAISRIRSMEKLTLQRYGNNSSLLISTSFSQFKWMKAEVYRKPTYISRLFKTNQLIDESIDLFASGFQIEVEENDLNFSLMSKKCLQLKPREVPFAAIFFKGEATPRAFSGNGWRPTEKLSMPKEWKTIFKTEENILYFCPLPAFNTCYLVLARPLPFLTIFSKHKLWLIGVFIPFFLIFPWSKAGKSLTIEKFQFSLPWKIACAFFLASFIPISVLAYFSFNRMLEVPQLNKMEWQNRMLRAIKEMDLNYKDTFERHQSLFSYLSSKLGNYLEKSKNWEKPLNSMDLQDTQGLLFLDSSRKKDRIIFPASQNIKNPNNIFLRLLKNLLREFLDQVIEVRGGFEKNSKSSKEPTPTFSIQTFLWEKNFLLDILINPGQISFTKWMNKDLGFFSDLIEDPTGRILGFLFIMLRDMEASSNAFLKERLIATPEIHGVSMVRFGKENKDTFPSYFQSLPELLEMANLTRSTCTIGKGEFVLGLRKHWILTAPTQYLQKYVIGASVLMEEISGGAEKVLLTLKAFSFLGFLICVLAGVVLTQTFLKPIRCVKDGVCKIETGAFDTRLTYYSYDEYGELATAFNNMTARIQERERLRRYVSSSVWDEVTGNAHPCSNKEKTNLLICPESMWHPELLSRYGKTSFEECSSLNAAVLYSDIRGFTPLSEHHPPEVIVSTLNDYFTLMERVIKAFGGTIEKFVGDAIIAVFRHHDGLSHPAMRAVNSGLAMKKALEEFNFKRQNDGKFQIANGVGIHYGTMFLGIIGRTSGRSDLFAFGKAIQVASRLEGLSKFGRESGIIFSESVAEHIPEDFERITISRNGQFAFELKFPSKK